MPGERKRRVGREQDTAVVAAKQGPGPPWGAGFQSHVKEGALCLWKMRMESCALELSSSPSPFPGRLLIMCQRTQHLPRILPGCSLILYQRTQHLPRTLLPYNSDSLPPDCCREGLAWICWRTRCGRTASPNPWRGLTKGYTLPLLTST